MTFVNVTKFESHILILKKNVKDKREDVRVTYSPYPERLYRSDSKSNQD